MSSRAKKTDSRSSLILSGPFRLLVNDEERKLSSKKLVALLAYLGRRSGIMVPRETVCGLLWADTGDEQARASLRQAVATLRKSLGSEAETFLLSDKTSLGLADDEWHIDLNRFFEASDREDHHEATELWNGEFLEGFAPVTPEFDRWLSAERALFEARYQNSLNEIMKAAADAREWEAALAHANSLLALNELQEHVHQTIMQVNIELGRFDVALKQFDALSKILESSLGISPDAKS